MTVLLPEAAEVTDPTALEELCGAGETDEDATEEEVEEFEEVEELEEVEEDDGADEEESVSPEAVKAEDARKKCMTITPPASPCRRTKRVTDIRRRGERGLQYTLLQVNLCILHR